VWGGGGRVREYKDDERTPIEVVGKAIFGEDYDKPCSVECDDCKNRKYCYVEEE
jgi:hypothetical protein